MKKKLLTITLMGAMALTLAACGTAAADTSNTDNSNTVHANAPVLTGGGDAGNAETAGPTFVTITDTNGDQIVVQQYPTVVAIYDYSVLDILYDIGFERTGITRLITPNQAGIPDSLSFFRYSDMVVTGGSLHWVDWDVLDLLQPQLVVLGARSFGMNAAGERLNDDDRATLVSDTLGRYSNTAFARLAVSTTETDFFRDVETNVTALAAIFPSLADDLFNRLEELKAGVADVHARAQASGLTSLLISMDSPTDISAHHPGSRFAMFYDEFGMIPVDTETTGAATVSSEYLLMQNPDVIFLMPGIRGADGDAASENFFNDPSVLRTNAAQNGRIYFLSPDAWHSTTGGFSATARMIEDINQFLD